MKNQGKVILTEAVNGEYYFKIIAENGEPLAVSEMYSSKQACKHGINQTVLALRQDNLIIEEIQ